MPRRLLAILLLVLLLGACAPDGGTSSDAPEASPDVSGEATANSGTLSGDAVEASTDAETEHTHYSDIHEEMPGFEIDEHGVLTAYSGPEEHVVVPDGVVELGEGAFAENVHLVSVALPESVENIGVGAFYGCTALETVTLADAGLLSIGSQAFEGCQALREFYIPSTVQSVGYLAFASCAALESINIPSGVTYIEPMTFAGCSKLEAAVLPPTLTSIGEGAFAESAILSIDIPKSVENIAYSAFDDTPFLDALSGVYVRGDTLIRFNPEDASAPLPDGIAAIGAYALSGSTIEEFTVPNGVSVGDGAFADTASLRHADLSGAATLSSSMFSGSSVKTVQLPEYVTEISANMFDGCASLTSVTGYGALTAIGDAAFNGCTALETFELPDTLTAIGDSAFSGCTKLMSISIPNTLKTLGSSVFSGCKALNEVVLPNTLTALGNSLFSGCTSLKTVTLPNTLEVLGSSVFSGCTSLTDVILPDSLVVMGGSVFHDCMALTSIVLPEGLRTVSASAFRGCTSLNDVDFGSVEYIADNAFENTAVLDVILPQSLTGVGAYAFYRSDVGVLDLGGAKEIGLHAFSGCKNLTAVTLPETLKTIGGYAFAGCEKLAEVTSEHPINSVGAGVFNGTKWISQSDFIVLGGVLLAYNGKAANVVIPDSVTKIGASAFRGNETVTSVALPDRLTELDDWAFLNCTSLTDINLRPGLIRIGVSALRGTGITEVLLPVSLAEVGDYAFADNAALVTVTIGKGVTLGYNAFSGSTAVETLRTAEPDRYYDYFDEATPLITGMKPIPAGIPSGPMCRTGAYTTLDA